MSFRLTRRADEDVIELYLAGLLDFGELQADRYVEGLYETFGFLAENPRAARERVEILPPVRIHPYRSHVIVYELDNDAVLILRVRHGREDWSDRPLD